MQCPRCNSVEIISKNKGWNFLDSYIGYRFLGFFGITMGGVEYDYKVLKCASCEYSEEFDSNGNYKPSVAVQLIQGITRGIIAAFALPFALIIFILCINVADKFAGLLGWQ